MKNARTLLKENNLQAKKSLGQNFLIDDNILKKISSLYNKEKNTPILEIGPGTGALTAYLNKINTKLYLVEIDKNMYNILKKEYPKIEIFNEDAKKFDFNKIFNKEDKEFTIFGNLPYNVSSKIIFNIINYIENVHSCYFMLQKEMALRLIGKINSKDYSRITVMTDLFFEKKIMFDVKANSFYPPPKINSCIIELKKKDNIENVDMEIFSSLIKDAFSSRRKKLKNNLKKYLNYSIENIIDLNKRAENITIEEYIKLSKHIKMESK